MGFNKQYYDIDNLRELYKINGIESIKESCSRANAIICRDADSNKVLDLLFNNDAASAKQILEKNCPT